MSLAQVSAPGKVLIAGGYLIVEPGNIGLSIGTTARFCTRALSHTPQDSGPLQVAIRSPQFKTEFSFVAGVATAAADAADGSDSVGGVVEVSQTAGPASPFIYNAVLFSCASIALKLDGRLPAGALVLELLASNDFYSQRAFLEAQGIAVTAAALREVPEHNPIVGAVSKTGLGSSAALTTSLVACLHAQFGLLEAGRTTEDPDAGDKLEDKTRVETVHRVAQIAHNIAQGKIGSGFDVFTAVYGTALYSRFAPSLVEPMMGAVQPARAALARLSACIDVRATWVPDEKFLGLPPRLQLLLGDIHQGGSSTPGMVAKVMAWRAAVRGTADNLWDRLGATNGEMINVLNALSLVARQRPAEYNALIDNVLRAQPSGEWGGGAAASLEGQAAGELELLWVELARHCRAQRELLRAVGEAAGVEIEPAVLTPLLDATTALPGVVAAGCPGAGGFDAIFALVLGGEPQCKGVEEAWERYPSLNVCPLLVRADNKGIVVEKC